MRVLRYRRGLRDALLTLVLCACGNDATAPKPSAPSASVMASAPSALGTPATPGTSAEPTVSGAPATSAAPGMPAATASAAAPPALAAPVVDLPAHRAFADLAAALVALIPSDTRVIGIGELHARTDRPTAASSLDAFTQALPAIADRISDLVLETWRVDPVCGASAVVSTKRLEATMQRPASTKVEVRSLADVARAAGIQLHAMTLTCDDYAAIAPASGEVNAAAMLTLTTRELARIATSAVAHRDREPAHRPWIAVYGGALHNDRFPPRAVAEWSYAAAVDRATGGHFVEIDVIAGAIAAADPASQHQPWFPLVGAALDPRRPVVAWQRGERSFVVIVP